MNSYPNHQEQRFERVLITGAGGFSGQFLADYIRTQQNRIQVFGLDLNVPDEIDFEMLQVDITHQESLDKIISQIKPDCVIHLASIFKATSHDRLYQVNVVGTVNLLESLQKGGLSPQPVVLIVGSSAKYGLVSNKDLPITEETPPRPVSHYGITKTTQELIGLRYYLRWGMQIIQACPFNLVGPGQSEEFLCGSIVKQIVEARSVGIPPLLSLGNLSPRRDYIDVRDAVRAYWNLVEARIYGEVFNVCSGEAHSVREVLDLCMEFNEAEVQIAQEETKKRSIDIPIQIGDYEKIRRAIGWKPTISLRDSLREMLDLEWRSRGTA